jgi:selenocysteine lyase/cysteine desulfurase
MKAQRNERTGLMDGDILAHRRRFIAGLGSAGVLGGTGLLGGTALLASPTRASPAADAAAGTAATDAAAGAIPAAPYPFAEAARAAASQVLARDEDFWAQIGRYYARTPGITNLEHGYWAPMAAPVQAHYLEATTRVNTLGAWYARREYAADHREAVARVARTLGAHPDEIVLTRNATEAVHNLIRQYRRLAPGDTVLYADIDYPAFKRTLIAVAARRGATAVQIRLPTRASRAQILDRYLSAFEAHPQARLLLATHASNQHGLLIPLADIAAAARARGIDVICDAAQSWGLVDLRIDELGVDWAGFNLHKWIGAPLGVGALYMRRGTLDRVAPYPGESDPDDDRAAARIHTGTTNFAATLTVPAALDFHEAVGGANKEARLRYLRSLWTSAALEMPHLEVAGGAEEATWSGIGSFRLRGRGSVDDAKALQARLVDEAGVFTVIRVGLADGAFVRVTPQVFTTPTEIERLVEALGRLRT